MRHILEEVKIAGMGESHFRLGKGNSDHAGGRDLRDVLEAKKREALRERRRLGDLEQRRMPTPLRIWSIPNSLP